LLQDYFYFKDFALRNRDAALKINTDGVLLAAWADIGNAISILDIGTAGGVIAFVLAYRNSNASVLGIDICPHSILEAEYNRTINPQLATNVKFVHQSLQEHRIECSQTYDHIVCNPPFFDIDNSHTSVVSPKQKAKHSYTLSLDVLLKSCSLLMTEDAKLSIVIDYRDDVSIDNYCSLYKFYITRKMLISGTPSKEPNRLLLELAKTKPSTVSVSDLAIRDKNGNYSEDYKSLTKDLYLNF
jgi:tRNA1Val (adenine37-N6)-methyltransferase